MVGILAIASCVLAGGLRKFASFRDWRLESAAVFLCALNAGLVLWQMRREKQDRQSPDAVPHDDA